MPQGVLVLVPSELSPFLALQLYRDCTPLCDKGSSRSLAAEWVGIWIFLGSDALSPAQAAAKAKESVPKLDLGGSSSEAKTA